MSAFGEEEGQVCWRDGCQGVIARHPGEGCSCHISPPCSDCVEPREFCPTCGWEASEDGGGLNDFVFKYPNGGKSQLASWEPRPLDPRKIDWRSRGHTNASMIKEGVYPEGTTQADVLAIVKGTFGGRFEHFGGGSFKYIAYTD